MTSGSENGPVLPRRAFVAAVFASVFAGSAVSLAMIGGVDAPEVGVFRFSRGTTLSNGDGERLRGLLSGALQDQRIRVTILGHTGTSGNADANLKLSQDRAALAADMADELGITSDRVTARGLGGSAPLAKTDDETERAYQARLARVEVILQVQR